MTGGDQSVVRAGGGQPAPWRHRGTRAPALWLRLLTVFVVVCMAAAAVLLLGWLTRDTGAVGFLAGTGLAAVSAVPVLAALVWLDRYEPEPWRLLAFCFGWGATVAAFVALVLNTASVVVLTSGGGQGLTVTATVVAPVVEEAAKGSVLLLVLWFRRAELDGVVDGIVLAGMSALGFAFTENIVYFGRALLVGGEQGAQAGLFALGVTFVLRGVLSPFAHPLFTACTGIGVGIASRSRSGAVRVLAPLGGYLVAVLLHSLWNVAATAGVQGFVSAYVLMMVPMFAVAVGIAVMARRREGRIIAEHLPAYVAAGWLAPGEVATLACLPARRAARALARMSGGPKAAALVRDYQHTATELAFLRERASRRGPGTDFQATEMDLLQRLARLRRQLPPPPTYPFAGVGTAAG